MQEAVKHIMDSLGDKITILRLLNREERELIGELFKIVRYPAGSICVKEGEAINYIGIIASGKMKFERANKITGRPTLLGVLEKGSHVGDFSMLAGRQSLGQVRAVEATDLLLVSHDELDAYMQKHPHIGIKILKGISTVLSIRLKNAIDKVMVLS